MRWSKVVVALGGLQLSLQVMASGTTSISGKVIKSRDQLHSQLAKELRIHGGYGKNLDAFFNVLSSDFSGENIIKIKHVNLLKAKLGTEYVDGFIQVIMNASEENSRIILVLE